MSESEPAKGKPLTIEDVVPLTEAVAKLNNDVKEMASEVDAKLKSGLKLSDSDKEQVDRMLSEQGTINARLQHLEQKAARKPGPGGPDMLASPGQRFIDDERVKAFCAARTRGRVRVDMAAITSLTNSAGVLVETQRTPGIITLPERRMTVRDLLTPGRTSSNAVEFVQETGFTNAARVVSEGTSKPESVLTYALETETVRTVAHIIRAAKQIMDDAPALMSQIDGRLRYGLAYAEENELLNGDGTGQHLDGLIPNATAFSAEFAVPNQQILDIMRLAILQSELAEFPATGIVLNPIDWARAELTKDTTGRYIFANPQGLAQPTLWNRPVVATQAMTENHFLAGAFRLGAQLFDREDANVEISTEDADNFTKNMITIRCEERLVLVIYRPECFVYGNLNAGT